VNKQILIILSAWLVVITIISALLLFIIPEDGKGGKDLVGLPNNKFKECPVRVNQRIVRGNSLEPLIKNGETVKILFGYYRCHEIKRGDVVVYSYAGNKNQLIKIVKSLPGDKFNLQKTEGGWHILINGETLKNSENNPYLLDESRQRILSLYERDYKGIMPENTYLILGNLTEGTFDSTHFGLVYKSDILGKVETNKK
jgi:signal peptidase I